MKEIYLLGSVQAVFFAILLFTKKQKQANDFVLTFFILLLGLDTLFNYSVSVGWYNQYPSIILSDFAYWALLGPLLFLYIDTTSKRKNIKALHLIHLLPLLVVFTFFSDYIFFHMHSKTLGAYYMETQYFTTEIGVYFWEIISPVYYVLAAFKLYKHRKEIKHYYSSKKGVSLEWLNYLTHGFGLYLIIGSGSLLLRQIFNVEIPFSVYQFSGIVMVIYIFGIGFWGYKQQGIHLNFQQEEPIKKLYLEKTPPLKRYERSGLTNDESKKFFQELKTYMIQEKPYLDCELTIKKLAIDLGASTHKLSQVINENGNMNFYEFINQYRIEEIKKRLTDNKNDQFKIESIAYDCGFNSKSSFYTLFKKHTSQTPSQYKKECLTQTG